MVELRDSHQIQSKGEDCVESTRNRIPVLKQIREALDLIENGSYGMYIDCDENIPQKRLEIYPYAVRCAACQEKYEKDFVKIGIYSAPPAEKRF